MTRRAGAHRPCACREVCGDVDEPEDGPPPWPVCKGLPHPPLDPVVRLVMVHRDEALGFGRA